MQKNRLWMVVIGIFVLVIGLVLYINREQEIQVGNDGHLPVMMQGWWRAFQKQAVVNINELTDESFAHQYALARIEIEQLGKNKERDFSFVTFPDGAEVREILEQYLLNDLEPFLADVLRQFPGEQRSIVAKRLMSHQAPAWKVNWSNRASGETDWSKTAVTINPCFLGLERSAYRHTISHELIHCLVQGAFPSQDGIGQDWLREGMTEFVTVRSADNLGWQFHVSGYDQELFAIGLLLPLAERELVAWYLSDHLDDERIYGYLSRHLLAQGVSSRAVHDFQSSWADKRFLPVYEMEAMTTKWAVRDEIFRDNDKLITESNDLIMEKLHLENAIRHFQIIASACGKVESKTLPLTGGDQELVEKAILSATEKSPLDEVFGNPNEKSPADLFPSWYTKELLPILRAKVCGISLLEHPTTIQEEFLQAGSAQQWTCLSMLLPRNRFFRVK